MSIIKNTLATFGAIGVAVRLHGMAMRIYLTKRIGEDYTELIKESRAQRSESIRDATYKLILLCVQNGEFVVAQYLQAIYNLFEKAIEVQEEAGRKANQ